MYILYFVANFLMTVINQIVGGQLICCPPQSEKWGGDMSPRPPPIDALAKLN